MAEKTFAISDAHAHLRLEFDLYTIDSWDGESARLYVDGAIVWELAVTADAGWSAQCGGNDNDGPVANVDVIFAHTSSTAQIRFTTTLEAGSDYEAWGVNRVRVTPVASPNAMNTVTGAEWTMVGGCARNLHRGVPVFDLEACYLTTTERISYCGADFGYTTATWIDWRDSSAGWRTLHRPTSGHVLLVQEGDRQLGAYTNLENSFRPSGYTISADGYASPPAQAQPALPPQPRSTPARAQVVPRHCSRPRQQLRGRCWRHDYDLCWIARRGADARRHLGPSGGDGAADV